MSSNNKEGNLVWIDLEMTGLKTHSDRIIEIAVVGGDAALVTGIGVGDEIIVCRRHR